MRDCTLGSPKLILDWLVGGFLLHCVEKDSEAASMSAMTGAGCKYGLSDHLFAIIGLGALWGSLWSHISPSHVTLILPFSFHHQVLLLLKFHSSGGQNTRTQVLLKSQFNSVTVVPLSPIPWELAPKMLLEIEFHQLYSLVFCDF